MLLWRLDQAMAPSCPLDRTWNSFISFAVVNHKDCHFKFQKRSWDEQISRGQYRDILFLSIDHTSPPNCAANFDPRILSIFWAHSPIPLERFWTLGDTTQHMCPIKQEEGPLKANVYAFMATSHMRLRACDHYTWSTLIGGKRWSRSKFASQHAWGTNGVCEGKREM